MGEAAPWRLRLSNPLQNTAPHHFPVVLHVDKGLQLCPRLFVHGVKTEPPQRVVHPQPGCFRVLLGVSLEGEDGSLLVHKTLIPLG